MVFDAILGQESAVAILQRALERGRVHHAYRFEGPDGVGKELTAFALAQSLLCSERQPIGCGRCSACHRAVEFNAEPPSVPKHPDLLLIQRGLYPPAVLGTSNKETTGIGVDQIRKIILPRVAFSPHEGRALVVIIRDAHQLTVQAANAMLKTLEEPRPGIHFILLTSQPGRLLDTIRSRTLCVRFAPLAETHIETILARHALPKELAPLGQGSARAAIELADETRLEEKERFASAVLEAAKQPDLSDAIALASASPSDRAELRDLLEFVSQKIAIGARHAVVRGEPPAAWGRWYEAVRSALDHLDRNAQPSLVVETMVAAMRA